MKKIFSFAWKTVLIFLGIILIGAIVLKLMYNEDIPQGTSGTAADELAEKMLDALNYDAFQEAEYMEWTFRDKNHYQWFLQENRVVVSWDNISVELFTNEPEKSIVLDNSTQIEGNSRTEAIAYAQENFNNDSFWMVAPFKVMDAGVEREIIDIDGKQQLLIRYTSGGSTPGDVYLWELDEDFKPVAFKMWVNIIPLDGIEAQWNDWYKTKDGYYLAKSKSVLGIEIPISAVSVSP